MNPLSIKTACATACALSLFAATAIADRVGPSPEPVMSRQAPAGAPMIKATPVRPTTPITAAAPSAQIAAVGNKLAGSYKCKGVSFKGDGSSSPLTAKLAIKLDLDNAWIQAQMAEDAPGTMRLTDYRTFDEIAKQWTRIQMLATSGHVESTSLGEKDGKWTWTGTAISPTGSIQTRDYEQQIDPKQLKLWGEALLSGTWTKSYLVTCTR